MQSCESYRLEVEDTPKRFFKKEFKNKMVSKIIIFGAKETDSML